MLRYASSVVRAVKRMQVTAAMPFMASKIVFFSSLPTGVNDLMLLFQWAKECCVACCDIKPTIFVTYNERDFDIPGGSRLWPQTGIVPIQALHSVPGSWNDHVSFEQKVRRSYENERKNDFSSKVPK